MHNSIHDTLTNAKLCTIERDVFTLEFLRQLQKGHILADYTICGVNGAPGVGKTSIGHFFCDESLPDTRTSTACMEQAKRFIIEIVAGKGRKCRLLDPSDMVDMIAENLSAGVSLTEEEPATSAVQVGSEHTAQPESSSGQAQAEPQQPAREEGELVHSKTGAGVASQSEPTPPSQSRALVLPRTAEIAAKIVNLKGSKEVLKAHFLLFVDCGGQPQFMEMIPIFMKHAYLRLLMFKLSDKLSQPPEVDYFAADGIKQSLGHFTQTNNDLIKRGVQMTQSQHSQLPMRFIESQPEQCKSIVVGTFKDKISESGESLEEKNRKLAVQLDAYLKYIIKRSPNEVIYAVNNKASGDKVPRDQMAEELLRVIETCGQSIRLKYPLAYYLLEVELRRAGRMLSRAECWAIAQQLMFESEQAMDVALQFFHAINLMFYFPEVVKEVVFVDPMAFLEWLTNVFEKSIKTIDATEDQVQTDDEIRLRDQALLTTSTLQSLQPKPNEEGITLPVTDMIKLLEHLLIIAPVQEESSTKYFMPSLLDSREKDEIVRPSCGAAAALRVQFSCEYVPNGVLCCLAVYMRSARGIFQWHIPAHHSEEATRLYKNELHFTLPEFGGGVTVIDEDTHYSVHVDSDLSPELLPLIWDDTSQGISDVCSQLSLTVTHSIGFECLCDKPTRHLAVVSPDHKSWVCSEDDTVTGTLSHKQKLWLPVETDMEAGLCTINTEFNLKLLSWY